MANEKYNGWSNHATWNFQLWISNEEANYNYWLGRIQELLCFRETDNWSQHDIVSKISQDLSDWVEDDLPESIESEEGLGGFFRDALITIWKQVDFYEIVDQWTEDQIEAGY